MPADNLTNLEQRIVELAAQRYRRPFFRWGHLLGWLSLPLVALSFVPAFKSRDIWIVCAVNLLIFEWYFVLSTRIIGKLSTQEGIELSQNACNEGDQKRTASPRFRSTWLTMACLLPLSLLVSFATSHTPITSRS